MNPSQRAASPGAIIPHDTPRTGADAGARPEIDARTIDVVVPVYGGQAQTRRCLESVLAGTSSSPMRVVVINDASPHPGIGHDLRTLAARDSRVELIESPANYGFVTSVNLGIALSQERDVVLLNSDTEVAGDWLDRLRRAAYCADRIATVTPFSNNATICSYPRFCEDNPLPRGVSVAELDRVFDRVNAGVTIPIPTAVGFCMYIRRACLQEIGLFDARRFGRGYGEENDFCMRAAHAGWRHVLAADVFVAHAGGVSFGAEKAELARQSEATLRRLHPDYDQRVAEHIAADPARGARLAVEGELLRMASAAFSSSADRAQDSAHAQTQAHRGVETQ
jgi:GT2 family glycosyltransferase